MILPRRVRTRVALAAACRLGSAFAGPCSGLLTPPVFVLGFNNSGKSTFVRRLALHSSLEVYPNEGNGTLWFPGFFPWVSSGQSIPPIWHDPEGFVEAALTSRKDPDFTSARAHLAVFQLISGRQRLLVDSGMAAAIASHLATAFPESKFLHVVRDGRIAAYVTAQLEWSRMLRAPARYQAVGCSLDFDSVLHRMARYWAWTVESMDTLAQKHPDAVLEVRYEDWCHDPVGCEGEVREFIGEDPALRPPPPPDTGSMRRMSSFIAEQIRPAQADLIDHAAGKALQAKGYSL